MKDIKDLYQLFNLCSAITTDSRNITEGSMFFALKGTNFDGNKFAISALNKGAKIAVVDDKSLFGKDARLFFVDNVLKALQDLARYHRRQLGIPIIGITGTNGKTTTKELTTAILSTTYKTLATKGNLNNHIGVPLTLLQMTSQHQLAVIEMGASKKGDIKELVDIAEPNYGIITNIGKAHLAGFGSHEVVKQTKGELYDFLRKTDGIAFINKDDDTLVEMSKGIRCVEYSTKETFTSGSISQNNEMFISVIITDKDSNRESTIKTQLIGAYNLYNILAATCVGQYFSVSDKNIQKALKDYSPQNNRSQMIKSAKNTIIADAYNANPSSMANAIDNFAKISTKQGKVIIIGDMNELGEYSEQEHINMVISIEKVLPEAEKIYCGPILHRVIKNTSKVFPDVSELSKYLSKNTITNKLILIKGSNSIKLGDIIPLL